MQQRKYIVWLRYLFIRFSSLRPDVSRRHTGSNGYRLSVNHNIDIGIMLIIPNYGLLHICQTTVVMEYWKLKSLWEDGVMDDESNHSVQYSSAFFPY